MNRNSNRPTNIDIVEVGGAGGVYQHSVALSVALKELGLTVRLHTASNPEFTDARVDTMACFDWFRSAGRRRQILIVWYFSVATLPRVFRLRGRVWIQGSFKPFLTLLMIAGIRVRGRRVMFSPHTLFTRHGGSTDQFFLDLCVRLSSTVVVYNSADFDLLSRRRRQAVIAPLLMYTPVVSSEAANHWRQRIRGMGISVCSIGQIRTDKNLPMLVHAAYAAGTPLLIAGADAGGVAELRKVMMDFPDSACVLIEEYLAVEDLAAIAAITGSVALPYSVASSSGVAVLAKAYGARILAYGVGDLASQADVVVQSLNEDDWASALRANCAVSRNEQIPLPQAASAAELNQLLKLVQGESI